MKILKHGDPISKHIRATCNRCGCEFECLRDKEAKLISDQREGDFYSVDCPDCGKLVTIDYKLTI